MSFIALLLASLAATSPASTNDFTAASFGAASFGVASFGVASFRAASFRVASFRVASFRAATVREPVPAAGSRMQSNDEFTAASFTAASFRAASFGAVSFRAATVREPVSAAGSRMQFYDDFTAASFGAASFGAVSFRAASFRAATVSERIPELLPPDTRHGAAAPSARAQDPLIEAGFEHFYNIEYAESIAIFQQAIKAAPEDASRYNHLAEAVLFGMMYRSGALESQMVTGGNPFLRRPKMEPTPEEQRLFTTAIDKVLDLTGRALAKNPNDEDALYAEGVALGFQGTYDYLVRKAWLESLREVTVARKLHNRVSEMDPARVDARMMQGAHDYLVGSLPLVYRMIGFLAGFHGDREQGIRTLRLVAEKGVDNKVDAQILLGVIDRRERRPWEVIPVLESLHARYPRNFLVLFELSQMYADMGDKAKALAPLETIERLKESGARGFRMLPEERIEFARGNLLFWYEDFDPAIRMLEQATAHAEVLDPNSGPSAWLRLGQCYDVRGRRREAQRAYAQAVAFTPASDPAREAKKYLSAPFTLAQKHEIDRTTKLQAP